MSITDIEKPGMKGGASLPDRSELPVRQTRKRAAEFLRRYYFETSHRTLERAPIRWALLNGQAHCLTADLIQWADDVVAAAPMVMGGRRPTTEQHTA